MANRHKAQALKKGGKVKPEMDAGNKNVAQEAWSRKKDGGEVAKKATGGKIEHKATGGAAAPRLDHKARGGKIARKASGGSNKNPFSSAKLGK